jgi:hypothetical protein
MATRKLRGERRRNLIVAASHVILLVRRSENAQLSRTAISEQVNQIQCALLHALCPILDVVRHIEKLTEPGTGPTSHAFVQPVDDRHGVEFATAWSALVVSGRKIGGTGVGVEFLPDLLQIDDSVGVQVGRAVEMVERRLAIRLCCEKVVKRQPQFLAQLPDFRVVLIDELSTSLDDLSFVESSAERPAPSARPIVRIVDVGHNSLLI